MSEGVSVLLIWVHARIPPMRSCTEHGSGSRAHSASSTVSLRRKSTQRRRGAVAGITPRRGYGSSGKSS